MEKLKYIYFNPLLDIYSKKDLIKECCASITYSNENENLLELDKGKSVDPTKPHLFSITNVPAYFNVNYYKNEAYSIKKYPSVNGYAICLDDYTDVESYMGQHLKRKVKGNILRGVRRLEQCFEITYKRFNGDIERYEYERILALLKEMIIKRFKERNEASDNIKSWKQLHQTLFSLIISKKASLYVIYDETKPISISVSYHYNRIFFYYITAYDTNYSKFSLGNVMLYKQLEWSFSNNYRFFEMGWGDLDYKRRWSNLIYTYEHHFVFPKKSVSGYCWAVYKGNKTRLIAYLISKKVNKKYKTFKVMFTKKQPTLNEKILYHLEQITDLKALNDEIVIIEKLDENTEFLRPILYDYCYSNVEQFNDIQLYRSNNKKLFVIAGKKQKVKVIFANK